MIRSLQTRPTFLLWFLAMVSLLLTFKLTKIANTSGHYLRNLAPESTAVEYNSNMILGIEYPESWDIGVDPVLLAVEESVHYDPAHFEASREWRVTEETRSRASVRFNKQNQAAMLAMFHQLHCLRGFHSLLSPNSEEKFGMHHSQHCANYLRLWALCDADLTLEPGDFVTRDFRWDRAGQVHTCRDWGQVYSEIDVNWNEWVEEWNRLHATVDG
ncbi:hypothetical protein CPC08DRAFT_693189 [Agrocybe pediades]|nr:hypothetical protein CPC08DRAFT_693189 [Agrocybe pediades]